MAIQKSAAIPAADPQKFVSVREELESLVSDLRGQALRKVN